MQPVITVENLSKAYRIGLKEEMPDTIVEALTGWLKAPVRNWKRLRSLNTFNVSPESRVQSPETGGNGLASRDEGKGTDVQSPRSGDALALDSRLSTLDSSHGNGQSATQHSALSTQHSTDIIWALRNVSFDVHEGEVVGIIGRNGAGKSTLLKVLSRITEPTAGRAVIRGRVSSLLEVGTGFHPELTGRENVYMNGTILGMTKREIDRKFDEIVDFSGVETFLDTPIKRYSSGMQVRLAFSVAAHLEPEILIVDEVLAVGDAEFQKKCLGKMQDVATTGRTVLFVSHNMGAVCSLCTRSVLIDRGCIQADDDTFTVVSHYQHTAARPLPIWRRSTMVPHKRATLLGASVSSLSGRQNAVIRADEPFTISIDYEVLGTQRTFAVGLALTNAEGVRILSSTDSDAGEAAGCPRRPGIHRSTCYIPAHFLAPGSYSVSLGIATLGIESFDGQRDVLSFEITDTGSPHSRYGSGRWGVVAPILEWEAEHVGSRPSKSVGSP